MDLNAIGIIEDAHGLSRQAVVAVDHGIDHRLSQRFERILRLIHAMEALGPCADAHISFEEILRLIDLLRQRAVKNTPVDVAPQAKLVAKKDAHHLRVQNKILCRVAE